MNVGGVNIPTDRGNEFLYGIEIESKGTKAHLNASPTDPDGFTPDQVKAAARAAAGLVSLIGRDEKAVIRHRDWAPGRKSDVLQPLSFWQDRVATYLTTGADMALTQAEIDKIVSGVWGKVLNTNRGPLSCGAVQGTILSVVDHIAADPGPVPAPGMALTDADVSRIAAATADVISARMKS
jgi:hypothetical protein